MIDPASKSNDLSQALHWALEASHDPAIAAADWMARDLDPGCRTAVDLLTHPTVSVSLLRKAKGVYKTMRIVGETAADRQMGARLYLAAVAAALVRHDERISRQSDAALIRNLRRMIDDGAVPGALREVAVAAHAKISAGPLGGPLDVLNEPD
ncbi:MAG: hypothetical protein ACYTGG_11890 [Planctomycetota bacterium]|jgi:hypothetical protein